MSHFKTYSVQARLVQYKEHEIETPEMAGVFLLEKALHQAVMEQDFLTVKNLLSKGASVNPWQYSEEVIHEILDQSHRRNKAIGRAGAFASAVITHQNEMVDLMWSHADFVKHGFRFLHMAVDCGNVIVVKRLLQEPLFQNYKQPSRKTEGFSLIQGRDLWKDIAEVAFRHHGDTSEQEEMSNQVFDLIFNHLQTLLKETERPLGELFGKKIEPITEHMWQTVMNHNPNEDVFLTLLYHGNEEGCKALFPQFLKDIQNVEVHHSSHVGMAFVGAYIKYPDKRELWKTFAEAVFQETPTYGAYHAINVLRGLLSNPVGDLGGLNHRMRAPYQPQESFSATVDDQKFLKSFFFHTLDFDKLFNWVMGKEPPKYSQVRNYYKHLNWTLSNLDDVSFAFSSDINQKILDTIGLDYSKMPQFCGRIEKQALLSTVPKVLETTNPAKQRI